MNLQCIRGEISIASFEEIPHIVVNKFEESIVSDFYKSFKKLEGDPKIDIIPIIINSYGGEIYCLLSMIDIIHSSTKPVCTIAMGKAMSCGAILLASGTKGYRFASKNTDIMIHEAGGLEMGKTTDIANGAKQLIRLNKLLIKMLQKQSNLKNQNFFASEIKKRANADWYLSPIRCKQLGLIDHVGLPTLLKG